MNQKKLNKMLFLGENQNVEFKTHIHVQSIGREICAFLNSGGGYVVCGINNNGNITGIEMNHCILQTQYGKDW